MYVSSDNKHQTVITTYEVTPGTCMDLLDELKAAFDGFIKKQQGFVSAAVHVNDAQTRITNYTQWETRDQFLATLRADVMLDHARKFSALSKTFEPVMCEVVTTYEAAQS